MFRYLALAVALFLGFLAFSSTPGIVQSPSYTQTPSAEMALVDVPVEQDVIEEHNLENTVSLEEEEAPSANPDATPKAMTPSSPPPIDLARKKAQDAVVNILCEPKQNGTMAVSGTGVMIDPRGVILTNAHVAQYVLLSARGEINLACTIRSGSPATEAWGVDLLYIPPEWVAEHAEDIVKTSPTGTGEHDYALLLAKDGARPLESPAFTPIETTITPTIVGKTVVLAAYPAEFSGFAATQQFLLSSSILTPVRTILTFDADTVDVLSFGAVALAQGGSSGGAVVDEDGRLIAIISTTSNREFIAERDLRGVTVSYINQALTDSLGTSLIGFLAGDVVTQGAQFRANQAPALSQQIIDYLMQH